MLAPLIGSNLIGINKEPPRFPSGNISPETLEELRAHKARVFNPASYYYVKLEATEYDEFIKNYLKDKNINKLFNTQLLEDEFLKQTEYFLNNHKIEGYISKKKMIKNYKNGELKRDLFYKDVKITAWF